MPHHAQVERLIHIGLPDIAGVPADRLRALSDGLPSLPGATVAVHPDLVPASRLAALLERSGKAGFVVEDMPDVDAFVPVPEVEIPDRPLYLLSEVDRGDDLRNRSPEEATPMLAERGRTPLTVNEGISWLLQEPEQLEPNHCFMCIASRKPKPKSKGYDARTPAIWISGGTGRDGRERRDAPKVGWCWWRNRHTWLGFASATGRHP